MSKETSDQIREALGKVVSEGTGKNAGVEGYEVGAKTGTSQKLPRGNGKYIASTLAFAPCQSRKSLRWCGLMSRKELITEAR